MYTPEACQVLVSRSWIYPDGNGAAHQLNAGAQCSLTVSPSWNTAGNLLKGLGCMVSLIPGVGTAIGAGLMVGGTALGAVGSATA